MVRRLWTFVIILLHGLFASSIAAKVQKQDLAYIACDVCEKTLSALFGEVKKLRQTSPKSKIDEIQIVELIEAIADETSDVGQWIRRMDINVVSDSASAYLKLEEPGGIAKCGDECKTIAQSARNLLQEEIDADELSALLWRNKLSEEDLKMKVCKKLTNRCKVGRKPFPAGTQRKDEVFEAQSEKDIEMERMMAQFKSMGLGANMFSKDDLGGMVDTYEDEEDRNSESIEEDL